MQKKIERLEARVTRDLKELFQHAADLEGVTLTDFIIAHLQQAAKEVIKEHEILALHSTDQQKLIEALLNPPKPNKQLIESARKYKGNLPYNG